MLALNNHNVSFQWKTYSNQLANAKSLPQTNYQSQLEAYSIILGTGEFANKSQNVSNVRMKQKKVIFLSKNYRQDLIQDYHHDLISNTKSIIDIENTLSIYEILGTLFLKKKDYSEALVWLRKGIQKGEPACMSLLENHQEIPRPDDMDTLYENLKGAVEKRVQLLRLFDNPENKETLQRLLDWLNRYEKRSQNLSSKASKEAISPRLTYLIAIFASLSVFMIFLGPREEQWEDLFQINDLI